MLYLNLPKSLFLSLGVFIIGSSLRAQTPVWLYTNNNAHFTGANVGIGTTNPVSKLDVFNVGGGTGPNTILRLAADGDGWDRVDHEIVPGGTTEFTWFAARWGNNWHWQRGSSEGRVRQMTISSTANLNLYYPSATTNDVKISLNPAGDSYLNGGNIGVGISIPQYKLDVNGGSRVSGSLFLESTEINAMLRIKPYSGSGASRVVDFFESPDVSNSAYGAIGIANTTWGAPLPSVCLISSKNGSGGPTKDIMMWAHDAPNTSNVAMTIKANSGNVLVGKTSQTNTSYKLDINGNARANKIVVNTTGADFVFEEDYDLRTLEEVQKYIRQNKHLPEIPSAKEMEKEGLDVGDMNIKLLQKIEELTLYLIEIKKENDTLKRRIEKLEDKK